jgi:hypothetical protein
MALEDRIARSRLIPPRPRPTWVRRPRVEARLREALEAPVVVVKAEPGYGKSTAVAQTLHHGPWPHLWYSLTEADRDPQRFLAHWIYAFRSLDPRLGRSAAERLHEPGGFAALDALANELVDRLPREVVLVLDDYHLADSPEIRALLERWLEQLPPALRLVLITRRDPELRGAARARAHRELREMTPSALAFAPEEVQELFAAQRFPLNRRGRPPPGRARGLGGRGHPGPGPPGAGSLSRGRLRAAGPGLVGLRAPRPGPPHPGALPPPHAPGSGRGAFAFPSSSGGGSFRLKRRSRPAPSRAPHPIPLLRT